MIHSLLPALLKAMKYGALGYALALFNLDAAAQAQPNGATTGINPLIDPFSVNTKVELPPLPTFKPSAAPLPPLPPVAPQVQTLPQGLRAILIRNNGQGLLGSTEAGALSIPVTHGKLVRIAGQDFHAEVTPIDIRLYASPKGKLVWEGSLASASQVSAPIDMSQAQFIPPLSAGVSPGLNSSATPTGSK